MKRLILLAAVAFFALPAAAQMQEAFPSYIQVNGRAEKEIAPDEFYLQIIINERDSKGKISVESQQRDMIAALKRAGVDVEKQLKMANLSSEFFKKNTSVATAKYQLQLGSSAMVAKVWQALDGLGISNVSILKVSHSKIEQYKAEVRVEAMQNARQSAATLAEAIGQKIGKCFYIYDSNNNVMPVLRQHGRDAQRQGDGRRRGRRCGRTARFQDHQVAVQRAGEVRARIGRFPILSGVFHLALSGLNGKCACVSRPARTSLRRNSLRDSRRRLAASVRLVLCEVRNPPACGPGRPVPAPNPRSSAGRS